MVSHQELGVWARDMATAVIQAHEEQRKVTTGQLIIETAERQTNSELRNALLAFAKPWVEQGSVKYSILRDYPDIFDGWFITVFAYGNLYNELDKVLLRFVDRPEEMSIDYFGPTGGRCDTLPDLGPKKKTS